MNAYFAAWINQTGADPKNFRPFDYTTWIGAKHQAFRRLSGMSGKESGYELKFVAWLNESGGADNA